MYNESSLATKVRPISSSKEGIWLSKSRYSVSTDNVTDVSLLSLLASIMVSYKAYESPFFSSCDI